jgi:hypothetical protein
MCQVMTAEMQSMLKAQGDREDVQAEVKASKKDCATHTIEWERRDNEAERLRERTPAKQWAD